MLFYLKKKHMEILVHVNYCHIIFFTTFIVHWVVWVNLKLTYLLLGNSCGASFGIYASISFLKLHSYSYLFQFLKKHAAKVLESDRGDRKFKTYGNAYFKIKFNDNLSLRTSFGGDYQNTSYKRWRGIEHSRKGASARDY